MKNFTSNNMMVCGLISGIVGLLVGLLLMGISLTNESTEQHPASISMDEQNKQRGLVRVTVVEECRDDEGRKWFLLHANDWQRCYTYNYRGKPGTTFWIHPNDIEGYHQPQKIDDLDIQLPPKKIK